MKALLNLFIRMFILVCLFSTYLAGQDDATFYKPTKNFYGKPDTVLAIKEVSVKAPATIESFKSQFHFAPIRQDTTGTCWAFCTISFFESEIFRLSKQQVKLSEMYVAYWEYVAKAREYIRTKGNSLFAQGSQDEAAILRMKERGIVRQSDYSGLLAGEKKHNHSKVHNEMKTYLNYVKQHDLWDEAQIIMNIKMILNRHLGQPPETIPVEGKKMTPKTYLNQVLGLKLDDYVSFMSFKYRPFFTKGSYRVPDNYWHSQEYHNIPLSPWYDAIVKAIKEGYTVNIGGDVSEIGKIGEKDIAFIPEFDIPANKIDQDAREFRFDNETSVDDHGIHLVGYLRHKGYDWFLIKDSGSSSHKGKFKGYYFYREDFVKLKMLTFTVHKDAVLPLLEKFKN